VLISKHAVRRYRQRFGKRTTSAHRVRRHIRNKIKYDTVKAYRSKTGSYNIVTDEFVARLSINALCTADCQSSRSSGGFDSRQLCILHKFIYASRELGIVVIIRSTLYLIDGSLGSLPCGV
jgi:hypothetical protein